jgi:hypothetical protein
MNRARQTAPVRLQSFPPRTECELKGNDRTGERGMIL